MGFFGATVNTTSILRAVRALDQMGAREQPPLLFTLCVELGFLLWYVLHVDCWMAVRGFGRLFPVGRDSGPRGGAHGALFIVVFPNGSSG